MNAYRIKELAKNGPFGRSKLFDDIAAGRLVARKVGGATVVLEDDWRRYLEGTPRAPSNRSGRNSQCSVSFAA